jgi:hypothetical protein
MKKMKYFSDTKLQFTYPYASIIDVKATGEALSPQKRTSSSSKQEISVLFFFLWVIFALLDPDTDSETLTGTAFKFSVLWKYFSQSHFLFFN